MPLHFAALASGSSGNASYIEADGQGLLLDVGLGPRLLSGRLRAVGAGWPQIQAVLLSHTHTDHWNDRTLAHLQRLRIPLYCHADHHRMLLGYSPSFAALRKEGLVRDYEPERALQLLPALWCRPFRVRHDGGLTCGFRFEGSRDVFGASCALGHATDLGTWHDGLAQVLADVDVLALEFNHDVALERASGRSPRLIARVLGDFGHLSNVQAAALVRQVVGLSQPGRLRHLVQMHLSQDCNRPELAVRAVREALGTVAGNLEIHTACQDQAGPRLAVGHGSPVHPPRRRASRRALRPLSEPAFFQPLLPGWEE